MEASLQSSSCIALPTTATIVVAGTGDSSNGGGHYIKNGRINFGYVAKVRTSRTGTTTVSGQMLWHKQGGTRLKGNVTAYTQVTCPLGEFEPDAPVAGTVCALVQGVGDLYAWNSTTNTWDLSQTGVTYQATVADGKESGGKKGKPLVVNPDYFRMKFPAPGIDPAGETTTLVKLKGGNIKVN